MGQPEPATQLRAWTRARPIRVAYLVEDHEHSDAMLDAIFADCYRRWGGRFTLVIPCSSGNPDSAYARWLELYDPDLIYSYVDLNEATVAELHERYYPSYLQKHSFPLSDKRDAHSFRPRLPLNPLTSLSVLCDAARGDSIFAPQPLWIIDSWWGGPQDSFLADSFGSFRASFARYPLPRSLGQFAQSITLTPAEAVNDPRTGPRPDDAVVCDRLELINRIADDPRIHGLAELSAWSCPRLEIRQRRWSTSFKLVVGDVFGDRLAFWNSRSLLPRWLDKFLCSARVPTEQLQDDAFVAALAHLLNRRNHVSEGSSSPSVTICSTSLTRECLEQVRDKLREHDRLTLYTLEILTSLEACAPDIEELSQSPVLTEWNLSQRSPTWEQVNFVGTRFRPSKSYPRHITDYQILPREARDGTWALDLDIERTSSHSPYTNVRQRWRLPRRLRMAGAFLPPYQGDQFAASWRVARATKEGFLSTYLSHEEAPPEILVPADRVVFSYALHHGPDSWTFDLDESRKAAAIASCGFSWSQLSNVGRYLTGVLHIFGGLRNAADILLHRFWMQQFEHLGATHSRSSEQRISEVIRSLKRRLDAATDRAVQITDDGQWEKLARAVLAEARKVRIPKRSISLRALSRRWDEYQSTHNTCRDNTDAEWVAAENDSLILSLQSLCMRDVFFQGYEWRCDGCYHMNWVPVQTLMKQITCEICGFREPVPAETPWNFRLNEFVVRSLVEHGILAMIWCLKRLSCGARECFFFSPSLDLYANYPDRARKKPDAEMDLLCVVDKQVYLCEVKSSARDVKLIRFIEAARRLRPNIALLAVMEEHSAALDDKVRDLRTALQDIRCTCELMTLKSHDFEDDTFLRCLHE